MYFFGKKCYWTTQFHSGIFLRLYGIPVYLHIRNWPSYQPDSKSNPNQEPLLHIYIYTNNMYIYICVYIYSADLRIHVLDDAGSTFRKAWGNCSGLGLRKGVKSLFSSAPLSAKLFSSHQKNHRFCHGSGFWNHSPVPFTEETSQKPSGNMMFSKKNMRIWI